MYLFRINRPNSTDNFISCVLPVPRSGSFTLAKRSSFFMTMQGVTPLLLLPRTSSLAPLEMGDSGISAELTRSESVWLPSLCKSEITTARGPVQHKRWTYPFHSAVDTEHHQRWTRRWWMTTSKHLTKGDNNPLGCRSQARIKEVGEWLASALGVVLMPNRCNR